MIVLSHFTKTESQIRDIRVLKKACDNMGLEIVANANSRGYQGKSMKGDYVIKLKGPYDIALIQESNGNYSLHTDWYQGHVEKQVGRDFGLLKQMYSAEIIRNEAESRGMMLEEERLANGTVRFHIRERVYNRA
jgi:hypothetical protein